MLSWTLLGYAAGIGLVLAFLQSATRKDEEYEEVQDFSGPWEREWLKLHTEEEQQLLNVMVGLHSPNQCAGQVCIIHRPTEGPHRTQLLIWRTDRGIFERICKHGVGHPDPDQNEYWEATGQTHQRMHGCDGCCHPWWAQC